MWNEATSVLDHLRGTAELTWLRSGVPRAGSREHIDRVIVLLIWTRLSPRGAPSQASRICAPRSRSSTSARSPSERQRRSSAPKRRDLCYQFAIGNRFPKAEAPGRPGKARKIRGLHWSGRLDLNQRPVAPQEPPVAAQRSPALPNSSESLEPAPRDAVQRSQGSTTIRKNFATNLLPPIERLLTVRQVAAQFGVCTVTVYKWAVDGVLPHVRIVNVVRVRPEDLTTFIAAWREL